MFEDLRKTCLTGKKYSVLRKSNIVQLDKYYQTEWEIYIYMY